METEECLELPNDSFDTETERYTPNMKPYKFVGEQDYYNVILVVSGGIKQNNLFTDSNLAINNFVNLVCEHADEDTHMTREIASGFVKCGGFSFNNGFVAFSKPNIK